MVSPIDPPNTPSKTRVASVLYLCNQNVIRSPMAEALTRANFGHKIYSASAGVQAGQPDGFVEAVLEELEIDVHNREPQALEHLDDEYFDLIVTLTPTAHHVALDMTHVQATEIEYWPTADPTLVQGSRDQRLAAYRDVRDRLLEKINSRFAE